MSEEFDLQRAKTRQETDKKCPACGGTMDFDPATGGLACPYCGHTQKVDEVIKPTEEQDFSTAEQTGNKDWGTAKKCVICKSCGAETVYDALEIAGECPYCGGNQVMEAADESSLAPGGVVPFQVTKEQAGEVFCKWLKGKWFTPSKAKKSCRPDAFTGLYLPYWTYDANTVSPYTARYGIDRRVKGKDGEEKTVTDWYPTRGLYTQFFDDVLVCGTERHNPEIIDRIEPFETDKNVAYRPEYVAGFGSERYSVGLQEGWERAQDIIKDKIESGIESQVHDKHHCDHVDSVRFTTKHSKIKYKYLLLPVWLSAFAYKAKTFQFMVNGQTGTVGGKAPVSALRVTIAILIGIAILVLLYMLLGG